MASHPLRVGFLLLLAFLLALVPDIRAQEENETFGVVPHPTVVDGAERRTFEIPLEVGREFEDAVRIYNRTDDAVNLAVYPAEAIVGDDDVISIGAESRGLASWITLERPTVELPPRGEEIVAYRIRIRSDRPDPELAVIVVENTAGTVGEGVDMVQRIAILVRSAPAGTPTAAIPITDDGRPGWLLWLLILPLIALGIFAWKRRGREAPADEVVEPPLVPAAASAEPGPVVVLPEEEEATTEGQPETFGDEEQDAPDEPGEIESAPDEPARAKKAQPPRRPRPKRPSGRNYIPLDEL